jgi:small subunit ribosomal protein S3
MGQKVRPTGFRTGIMVDWVSRWYANKQDFAELLVEDQVIRKFIKKRYGRSGISKIRIERTREKVTVFIFSARVGMIIGKKGQEVDKLTKELEDLTHRHIEIKTMEVNRPEIDPQLVAEDIAEQLEKRASFRRTMKRAMDQTMEGGARGVRVQLAGRLGGAEMARTESAMNGSIPLSTLRAKIEFGFTEASRGTSASRCGLTTETIWTPRRVPMPLMPKRVKFRKSQRGKVKGNATRGNTVTFGEWGLQALEGGWLSAEAIEAGRITATHSIRGEGRLYIRVFPHKSVTSIPAETRMGKGKGEPEFWAAVVKPGMILFEVAGLPETAARDCLARVAYKMPFRCRLVSRRPNI